MTSDLITSVKIARNYVKAHEGNGFKAVGSVVLNTQNGEQFRVENNGGVWEWVCISGPRKGSRGPVTQTLTDTPNPLNG